MHKTISYNGKLFSFKDPLISSVNAGLLHGYGVFTTLAIYNAEPFLFEQHWQRLRSHVEVMGMVEYWKQDTVYQYLQQLIKHNGLSEGKARISLFAANSPFWHTDENKREDKMTNDLLIFTAPLPLPPQAMRLTVSPDGINSLTTLAGIKVMGNPTLLVMQKRAQATGFDDALLLNQREEICETTAANIFWVKQQKLYTPALNTGCLAGTTRQLVLRLAQQLVRAGIEGYFPLEHIMNAEEVFLTSSTKGLVRVTSIDNQLYPPISNYIYEKLQLAYMQFCKQVV